jgi:NAD(P)H-hydrate epimerase
MFQGEVLSLKDADQVKQLEFDIIVDAIFGTGLDRVVSEPYADVIQWLNQQNKLVLAVDIPSGLNGSSGCIEGVAVNASDTVAILARNTGLFTADGRDCCGEIHFESLHVPESVYSAVGHTASLLDRTQLKQLNIKRINNSHKGQFGHVLTVGGQAGMMGAVLLAAKAVLKAGAGSTTVITDPDHASLLALHTPELMSLPFDGAACMDELAHQFNVTLKQTAVMLCGMGLGQSQWSQQLFNSCLKSDIPLVLDADGLNLLVREKTGPSQLKIITPHPKEAAQLLNCSVLDVQNNRWNAVQSLAKQYQCVAVLKGSGTLISDGESTWCCPYGNANLATAGSGDVLAGMIAGLLAQGWSDVEAAQLAVLWHAVTGEESEFGMTLIATELLNSLHRTLICEP